MKYSIITLGCKVNGYESEIVKENMNQNGYQEVSCDDNPEVIIINTCTVTNNADSKSMHAIRMTRKNNPESLLIVCGCMIESHKDNLDGIDADIIIGNKDKSKIVDLINDYNNQKIINVCNISDTSFEDMTIHTYNSKTRAFIKIQDGCNNYCTYCIIPYVRGQIRSKDFNKVISEVNELSNNHSEIVLTGIHTGSYNSDGRDLTDLIHEISICSGIQRIRISSIEITELNDKFLNELKNNTKICDHLHIPLQSGCDKILKLMNRKYNTDYYLDKINTIRSIRPNISITTDLIVGFPGETEEDFNKTIELIKKIEFTKVHVFPYSIRKGTVAASMPNHLTEGEKHRRSRIIYQLSNNLERCYYNKFINQELSVLIEKSDTVSSGHTDNYIYVNIPMKLINNQMYQVIIKSVNDKEVIGELVK